MHSLTFNATTVLIEFHLLLRKRKKSVEAKPLVLDEMVETVGDTYWTSGAPVSKKNVRGPILRTRSGMCPEKVHTVSCA